jgi:hypothetical protein
MSLKTAIFVLVAVRNRNLSMCSLVGLDFSLVEDEQASGTVEPC